MIYFAQFYLSVHILYIPEAPCTRLLVEYVYPPNSNNLQLVTALCCRTIIVWETGNGFTHLICLLVILSRSLNGVQTVWELPLFSLPAPADWVTEGSWRRERQRTGEERTVSIQSGLILCAVTCFQHASEDYQTAWDCCAHLLLVSPLPWDRWAVLIVSTWRMFWNNLFCSVLHFFKVYVGKTDQFKELEMLKCFY